MHNKKGLAEYLVIVLILIIGSASIYLLNNYFKNKSKVIADVKPTKTPIAKVKTTSFEEFPFMELAIPYLRFRDYQSELGELNLFEEHDNFKSYLTSYNSDGLKINGYLTIPEGEGPHPAIVFLHGYIPPTIYKTTQNYVKYANYLAENGFVIFKIDLRGHDNSEGESLGAYFSGDYIIDTLNAYAALQNTDFVDDNSIGLWGHSMGGNVVFRSLVAHQNIPAVVIWAGAVYTYEDMQEFSIQDTSYRPPTEDSVMQKYRNDLYETYGRFDANSEFWQKVVPTNYLENVESNLLINHAIDDDVVSIDYSRNLIDILNNSDVNADLVEHETGGHNIISPEFEKAMNSNIDFFKKYLK